MRGVRACAYAWARLRVRAERVGRGAALRWAPDHWLVRSAGRPGAPNGWIGAVGEELVARGLYARGWTVLARNVRAPEAELDLVARDGPFLVVVEVKASAARPGGRWRPADHVSARDVARRLRAAQRIARGGRARVDVVELELGAPGPGSAWTHHRGVTPGAPLPRR